MCSLRGRGRLGLACLTVEFYCCHHSTLYLMFYKSASIHYFTRNDNHFTTYIPLQSVSLFWNIPYRTRANKGRSLYSKIIFQLTTMVCFDKFHAYQHKNNRQNVIKMYLCGYYSRASLMARVWYLCTKTLCRDTHPLSLQCSSKALVLDCKTM